MPTQTEQLNPHGAAHAIETGPRVETQEGVDELRAEREFMHGQLESLRKKATDAHDAIERVRHLFGENGDSALDAQLGPIIAREQELLTKLKDLETQVADLDGQIAQFERGETSSDVTAEVAPAEVAPKKVEQVAVKDLDFESGSWNEFGKLANEQTYALLQEHDRVTTELLRSVEDTLTPERLEHVRSHIDELTAARSRLMDVGAKILNRVTREGHFANGKDQFDRLIDAYQEQISRLQRETIEAQAKQNTSLDLGDLQLRGLITKADLEAYVNAIEPTTTAHGRILPDNFPADVRRYSVLNQFAKKNQSCLDTDAIEMLQEIANAQDKEGSGTKRYADKNVEDVYKNSAAGIWLTVNNARGCRALREPGALEKTISDSLDATARQQRPFELRQNIASVRQIAGGPERLAALVRPRISEYISMFDQRNQESQKQRNPNKPPASNPYAIDNDLSSEGIMSLVHSDKDSTPSPLEKLDPQAADLLYSVRLKRLASQFQEKPMDIVNADVSSLMVAFEPLCRRLSEGKTLSNELATELATVTNLLGPKRTERYIKLAFTADNIAQDPSLIARVQQTIAANNRPAAA